jgi:hypothetical protein
LSILGFDVIDSVGDELQLDLDELLFVFKDGLLSLLKWVGFNAHFL